MNKSLPTPAHPVPQKREIKMGSTKKLYLHLIDGRAAYFSPNDEQIVLMENSAHWIDEIGEQTLRATYMQIRRDQIITQRNRSRWGFTNDAGKYGYAVITLPQSTFTSAANYGVYKAREDALGKQSRRAAGTRK